MFKPKHGAINIPTPVAFLVHYKSIYGLVQDYSNSIAMALESLQSYPDASIGLSLTRTATILFGVPARYTQDIFLITLSGV